MATRLTLSSISTSPSSCSELEASTEGEEEGMESGRPPSATMLQQPPPLVRDLMRRLRNHHSSAKFRERQRLRVDELRAQIAFFERENRALELRIQQILEGELQGGDEEENNLLSEVQYFHQGHPSASRFEEPLRTVEILSDDELLLAIQRSFANFNRGGVQ